jgi:hypothetical protein
MLVENPHTSRAPSTLVHPSFSIASSMPSIQSTATSNPEAPAVNANATAVQTKPILSKAPVDTNMSSCAVEAMEVDSPSPILVSSAMSRRSTDEGRVSLISESNIQPSGSETTKSKPSVDTSRRSSPDLIDLTCSSTPDMDTHPPVLHIDDNKDGSHGAGDDVNVAATTNRHTALDQSLTTDLQTTNEPSSQASSTQMPPVAEASVPWPQPRSHLRKSHARLADTTHITTNTSNISELPTSGAGIAQSASSVSSTTIQAPTGMPTTVTVGASPQSAHVPSSLPSYLPAQSQASFTPVKQISNVTAAVAAAAAAVAGHATPATPTPANYFQQPASTPTASMSPNPAVLPSFRSTPHMTMPTTMANTTPPVRSHSSAQTPTYAAHTATPPTSHGSKSRLQDVIVLDSGTALSPSGASSSTNQDFSANVASHHTNLNAYAGLATASARSSSSSSSASRQSSSMTPHMGNSSLPHGVYTTSTGNTATATTTTNVNAGYNFMSNVASHSHSTSTPALASTNLGVMPRTIITSNPPAAYTDVNPSRPVVLSTNQATLLLAASALSKLVTPDMAEILCPIGCPSDLHLPLQCPYRLDLQVIDRRIALFSSLDSTRSSNTSLPLNSITPEMKAVSLKVLHYYRLQALQSEMFKTYGYFDVRPA